MHAHFFPPTYLSFLCSNPHIFGFSGHIVPATALSNVFSPRARRFSASFSPIAGGSSPSSKRISRISQLRQEEFADITNAREVSHEREVISDMQMSQSYEDLSIITEGWTMKSEDSNSGTNPLHLNFANTNLVTECSSPSPTRHNHRFPYHHLSPSPTRKAFATTRRSMSPIAIRPSSLSSQLSIKRKFEVDDGYSSTYSPPPIKRVFIDRNPSPSLRQTPSPMMCPSPDSCASSYEGRITPKLFVSKLISTTSSGISNSVASSPATEVSSDDAVEMDCTPTSQTDGDSQANGNNAKNVKSECNAEAGLDTEQVFKEPDKLKIRSIIENVKEQRAGEAKDTDLVKVVEIKVKADKPPPQDILPTSLDTDENMVSTTSTL